jgi:hypothetical protein
VWGENRRLVAWRDREERDREERDREERDREESREERERERGEMRGERRERVMSKKRK